jgi:hypothetical protein
MNCSKSEQWLSEYLEASLPAEETELVAKHLETCANCSALLAEMRLAFSLCEKYPVVEMDPDFVERILLRTSGRPRTRSFRERFDQYFLRPLLTPRFAVGASLAALFLVLMTNLMVPRLSGAISSWSPKDLMSFMDQGVHRLYGQVLKAYDLKDNWESQFSRLKNNTWNNVRSVIDQIDEPVEGRKKSQDGEQQEQQKGGKAPKERTSGLMSSPA